MTPSQTLHYSEKSLKSPCICCLFDPLKIGNLMTPVNLDKSSLGDDAVPLHLSKHQMQEDVIHMDLFVSFPEETNSSKVYVPRIYPPVN